jgi:uncharacterized membrane protein YdbT with pleckstrin-like domain
VSATAQMKPQEVRIQPSLKVVKAKYALAALLVAASWLLYRQAYPEGNAWIPGILLLLFLWPVVQHFDRRSERIRIVEDKLRFESGWLSKSTRALPLGKIQDVEVRQRLGQRMLGVGDLTIQALGERSSTVIHEVDRPNHWAELILSLASRHGSSLESRS